MSSNNCNNCLKVQDCDCLCHKVEIYSKFPHDYHRPEQLKEQEPEFKAQQLKHYRDRFPGLKEKEIQKMYEDNLYS